MRLPPDYYDAGQNNFVDCTYCQSRRKNNAVNGTELYNKNLIIEDILTYCPAPGSQEATEAPTCAVCLSFLHVLEAQPQGTAF